MAVSEAMLTALRKEGLIPFAAVRMTLPTVTLCLLDGSGVATFAGSTFVGMDDTYGALAAIEDINDGGEGDAPRARFRLNPKNLAAMTVLASSLNQDSKVEIWEGLIAVDTGLVVPDPDLCFEGFYDQPSYSPRSMELSIDCRSIFEEFFENDEGALLTDSFHKSIWPTEDGFQYVTENSRNLPWGTADVPRVVTPVTAPPRSYLFNSGAR